MSIKLYVGGLDYNVTDQELEKLFQEEGKVLSATVIKDKFSGQSKGFGFVEMEDLKEAQNAMNKLNGKEISGRALVVNPARPPEDRRYGSGRQHSGNNFRRPY